MIKILILIIIALGIILLLFRRHFDSAEKIRRLFKQYFLLVRFAYMGFALLWLSLNKHDIMLSSWDAQRVGIPLIWYTVVPAFFLLLYAAFPLTIIWSLSVGTLILGWTLHLQETVAFCRTHMNVKTDFLGTVVIIFLLILILVACMTILYLTGPYAKKVITKQKKSARI